VKFDENDLVPAVIQDAETKDVLMLAYMNDESLRRTQETRETWFWSRSRSELWHKGAVSGNTQSVIAMFVDCDQDAVLVRVRPNGPACHTGERSCFHQSVLPEGVPGPLAPTDNLGRELEKLYEVIESRKRERPEGSYTSYLFQEGIDKILKKVGEEAAETLIAAKNENQENFVSEVADLIYHLVVLLSARNTKLNEIALELARRGHQQVTNGNKPI